jgi:hypothetical protein
MRKIVERVIAIARARPPMPARDALNLFEIAAEWLERQGTNIGDGIPIGELLRRHVKGRLGAIRQALCTDWANGTAQFFAKGEEASDVDPDAYVVRAVASAGVEFRRQVAQLPAQLRNAVTGHMLYRVTAQLQSHLKEPIRAILVQRQEQLTREHVIRGAKIAAAVLATVVGVGLVVFTAGVALPAVLATEGTTAAATGVAAGIATGGGAGAVTVSTVSLTTVGSVTTAGGAAALAAAVAAPGAVTVAAPAILGTGTAVAIVGGTTAVVGVTGLVITGGVVYVTDPATGDLVAAGAGAVPADVMAAIAAIPLFG